MRNKNVRILTSMVCALCLFTGIVWSLPAHADQPDSTSRNVVPVQNFILDPTAPNGSKYNPIWINDTSIYDYSVAPQQDEWAAEIFPPSTWHFWKLNRDRMEGIKDNDYFLYCDSPTTCAEYQMVQLFFSNLWFTAIPLPIDEEMSGN